MYKTKEEGNIDIGVPEIEEEVKSEAGCKRIQNETNEVTPGYNSGTSSISGMNDIGDEFFDVPAPSDDEEGWPSNTNSDSCYVVFLTLGFEPQIQFISI